MRSLCDASEDSWLNFVTIALGSQSMEMANVRVRRATLDDLTPLTALWQTMHLAHEELGKRVTEFQLAENPEVNLSAR